MPKYIYKHGVYWLEYCVKKYIYIYIYIPIYTHPCIHKYI